MLELSRQIWLWVFTPRFFEERPDFFAELERLSVEYPYAQTAGRFVDAKGAPVKGDPPIAFVPPSGRYDAIASFDLIGRDGSFAQVVGTREPGGKLRLRRGAWSRPSARRPPTIRGT